MCIALRYHQRLETGREDTVPALEIKAAAGEAATEVTDLAMRVCGRCRLRKEVGPSATVMLAQQTVMAPTTIALQ